MLSGAVENCPTNCKPPKYCTGSYNATWWKRKPYIEHHTITRQPQGLFKDILELILTEICYNCSEINFELPLNGSFDVESRVEENNTDFAFPIYGLKEQEKFRGNPFIPLGKEYLTLTYL